MPIKNCFFLNFPFFLGGILFLREMEIRNFQDIKRELDKGKTFICSGQNIALAVDFIQSITDFLKPKCKYLTLAEIYQSYFENKANFLKIFDVNELLVIPDLTRLKDKYFWGYFEMGLNNRIIKTLPTLIGTNLTVLDLMTRLDTSLIEEKAEILVIEEWFEGIEEIYKEIEEIKKNNIVLEKQSHEHSS